jgi:DNA polymerase-3 subunit chi
LSGEITSPEPCQVDFYLLGESSSGASILACRLALMAWERKQEIFIITATASSAKQLDDLMWQYPEGRFLPHARANEQDSAKAAVNIGTLSDLNPTDVVINLCSEVVPQAERFSRVLEIVPFADDERQASRVKYKTYRNLGIKPQTHEIKE